MFFSISKSHPGSRRPLNQSEFKPRAIYGANFSGVPSHADTDGHGARLGTSNALADRVSTRYGDAAGETYGVANVSSIQIHCAQSTDVDLSMQI
jgi:hypothetical protein